MFSTQFEKNVGIPPARPFEQMQRGQPSKRSSAMRVSFAAGLSPFQGGNAEVLTVHQPQYDWEKEVATLDQKEMELHQTQMKLIRDQMHNIIQDVVGLHEEVGELRLQRESDNMEVQAFQEEMHRDKEDAQAELIALVQVLQEDNMGRSKLGAALAKIAKIDQLHDLVADLRENHDSLAKDKEEKHATLQKRVDYLESMLGDAADKHEKDLEALQVAHDKHAVAMSKHGKHFDDHKDAVQCRHASLQGRIDEIEQILDMHANKHGGGLLEAISKIEQMQTRLTSMERSGSILDELRTNLSKQKEEFTGHFSFLKDRVDAMGCAFNEDFDKHSRHLRDLQVAHDEHMSAMSKHTEDLEALRVEKQATHQAVTRRLDGVEQLHGETAAVLYRLAGVEKHGAHIGNLQRSHDTLAARNQELESSHAIMVERISHLEKTLGDFVETHAKELRTLRDSHSKHAGEFDGPRGLHSTHSTVDQRLASLESAPARQKPTFGFHLVTAELWASARQPTPSHGRLGPPESGSVA